MVVATGDDPGNGPIIDYCRSQETECFVGSEERVLDRIHHAAEAYGADVVVAITADCPLVHPDIVDRIIGEYEATGVDLCATSPSYTYPDGFGVEVLSAAALRTAFVEAESPMEREHLSLFIRRHPERFGLRYVENDYYHPFIDLHLSVDDEHDARLVSRLFERFLAERPLFGLRDVVQALTENPAWLDDHPATPPNEGYFKGLLSGPAIEGRDLELSRSNALLERARSRIPSCTQTFSKGFKQFTQGVSPVYVERGQGGVLYDVDGNHFIDIMLGLGAVTLGYGHPDVDAAVATQLRSGVSFSLPHRLELELAERLCDAIPCAEMVRFGKNGSDATTGAVRVARAFTGREKVLCSGYHGWHDWYIGTTTRRVGVPASTEALTFTFPYGDLGALEALLHEHHGQVAAVVMEPMGTVLPPEGYLAGVKDLVGRHGALLIFDEMVTGYRVALGGAQAYFGVLPDIACFGKGMANGYPLSAVVGRRDVMEVFDRAFFSFTFGGEAVSLAAALATLDTFERDSVVSHLWVLGRKLKDAYNYLSRKYRLEEVTWCQGLPCRLRLTLLDTEVADAVVYRSIFQQECARRGVLTNCAPLTCRMHTDAEVEQTIRVFAAAMDTLAAAYRSESPDRYLLGPSAEPVFRKSDY